MLVLLLTAWAYSLAFAHERSYLAWFGIPADFTEVNLRALLTCGGTLLVLGFAAYMLVSFFGQLTPRVISPEVQEDVAQTALWLIGLAFLVRFLGGWPWPVFALFLMPIGLIVLTFVVPIFTPKLDRARYWERLEASALYRRSIEIKLQGRSPFPLAAVQMLGVRSIWLLMVMLASVCVASFSGEKEARGQSDFLMSPADGCVVLRAMSEGLLCASVDALHPGHLLGEFRFLKPENVTLELCRIGRLFVASGWAAQPGDGNPRPSLKSCPQAVGTPGGSGR